MFFIKIYSYLYIIIKPATKYGIVKNLIKIIKTNLKNVIRYLYNIYKYYRCYIVRDGTFFLVAIFKLLVFGC